MRKILNFIKNQWSIWIHPVVFADPKWSPPQSVVETGELGVLFADPVTPREVFDKAKTLDEFINNFPTTNE